MAGAVIGGIATIAGGAMGGGGGSSGGGGLSKEQIQQQKDELQFTKDQYNDWQAIYGPIQKNLGAYYDSLTPEKLAVLGLQNQQKEFEQVRTSIKRDFAQRGLTGSGAEDKSMTDLAYGNAVTRAGIRTDAPQKLAEEKMGFLGIGLGQGQGLLANVAGASQGVNQAYSSGIQARTASQGFSASRSNTLTSNLGALARDAYDNYSTQQGYSSYVGQSNPNASSTYYPNSGTTINWN